MKEKQLQDITALYGRLSRDDEVGGESMSIQSQRAILGQYAKEHGFTNCQFFMDDGYSGTNFDRPAFTEMMELVEQRRVRTIIVKDLSRLGRNYLEVGRYTEVIFPENKVRFIAITDGVDSAAGDNEFAPFKNIINEWYAKDISRKVKSAFKAKALRGEYTGAYPPYGYDRDPNDRHKLVPNQYAWVVKEIFQMALAGKSCSIIAKELGEKQVLRPQAYLHEKFGTFASDIVLTYPYAWDHSTVRAILMNQVYIGNMVHFRTGTQNFKSKKMIWKPEEDWVVVEDTHEALVNAETFWTVQERIKVKQPGKSAARITFSVESCSVESAASAWRFAAAKKTSAASRWGHSVATPIGVTAARCVPRTISRWNRSRLSCWQTSAVTLCWLPRMPMRMRTI